MSDPLSPDAEVIGTELISDDVQLADDAFSSDADLMGAIDAELMRSDVRDIDEVAGLDASLIDAEPMTDDAPSEDKSLSLGTDLATGELTDIDAQGLDELSSLDVYPREAELMSSDAQSDVRDVGESAYTEVWLVPGPYSGVGPTGYDNSGDATGQEVYSRLTQHGQVDASKIEITIDNGEVLLEGTVDSEATKHLAEEAVETVTGVSRVQNLLRVQTSQDS